MHRTLIDSFHTLSYSLPPDSLASGERATPFERAAAVCCWVARQAQA